MKQARRGNATARDPQAGGGSGNPPAEDARLHAPQGLAPLRGRELRGGGRGSRRTDPDDFATTARTSQRPRGLRDDRDAIAIDRCQIIFVGASSIYRQSFARVRAIPAGARGGSPLFSGVSVALWYKYRGNRVPDLLIRRLSVAIDQKVSSKRSKTSASFKPLVSSGAIAR